MERIGSEKRKFLFHCKGAVAIRDVFHLMENFIAFVGMTPARPGRVDSYPYNEAGGHGYTGFFPLTQSYVVIDVYTDFLETEILLSTCVPSNVVVEAVRSFLGKFIGPTEFKGVL